MSENTKIWGYKRACILHKHVWWLSYGSFSQLDPLPPPPLSGLELVVSPLLALMRDQLDRLPEGLPGAMLWGGQTRSEAEAIIADTARGAIKLL